jgi:mannose/fructose/N-acetylgalactosamine-specific phosphotransferase system component IID
MTKLAKTIVTVIITIIFIYIFSAIGNSGAQTGSILGYISILLLVGYIGALIGIWKKKNEEK